MTLFDIVSMRGFPGDETISFYHLPMLSHLPWVPYRSQDIWSLKDVYCLGSFLFHLASIGLWYLITSLVHFDTLGNSFGVFPYSMEPVWGASPDWGHNYLGCFIRVHDRMFGFVIYITNPSYTTSMFHAHEQRDCFRGKTHGMTAETRNMWSNHEAWFFR